MVIFSRGSQAALCTLVFTSVVRAQAPGTLAHATHQYEQRNWDVAKQEFGALAKSTPNDVMPVMYLGRIALAQNETEEAIRQFERCVDINDRNADCHSYLGQALGGAAQRANKFKLPFLAKRTKKEFDRAVELDPDNIDARSGLLQYYMYAPGFLGGSMDKAREHAAEIDKRSKLRGALAMGLLADHEKKTAEAEAFYNRAIAIAPDSSVGYNVLMNVYVREKRWNDAFAVMERLIARVPSDMGALLAVSRIAYMSGEQLPRGEEYATRWLANPPKDATPNAVAVAHLRLGHVYEKGGKKELARAEYQRALQLNPRLDDAKKGMDSTRP